MIDFIRSSPAIQTAEQRLLKTVEPPWTLWNKTVLRLTITYLLEFLAVESKPMLKDVEVIIPFDFRSNSDFVRK